MANGAGPNPNDPATSLRRVLGLMEVTAGGVGIIIGAGIYVLLGAATAHAGPLVWLAFLVAAVLSALTGLSYAELSSMFPSAAGEYEYTRRAMPEWVAFVVGSGIAAPDRSDLWRGRRLSSQSTHRLDKVLHRGGRLL